MKFRPFSPENNICDKKVKKKNEGQYEIVEGKEETGKKRGTEIYNVIVWNIF